LFTTNIHDTWKLIIDIDLTAVILGTRLAITEFKNQNSAGVILNTASMAGLVTAPLQPVYAGAKAGVVNFSNSLGYLSKTDNIRVIPICPLFAKTKMTALALENGIEIKQWVTVDMVIDAFVMGIEDESIAGESIRITPKFGIDIPSRRTRSKI
jgi:short-subunit dehydrogenase